MITFLKKIKILSQRVEGIKQNRPSNEVGKTIAGKVQVNCLIARAQFPNPVPQMGNSM